MILIKSKQEKLVYLTQIIILNCNKSKVNTETGHEHLHCQRTHINYGQLISYQYLLIINTVLINFSVWLLMVACNLYINICKSFAWQTINLRMCDYNVYSLYTYICFIYMQMCKPVYMYISIQYTVSLR